MAWMGAINVLIFDVIDETMVMKPAQTDKGRLRALWSRCRRMASYIDFKWLRRHAGNDLRMAIVAVMYPVIVYRNSQRQLNKTLDGFETYIPLNKMSGLRPIGVGKVLRRVMGKVVMSVLKPDVVK